MPKIYPKEEYCLGCKLCEIYCATEHSKSKNILKVFKETPRPVKRIVVEVQNQEALALSCRHCEDPACLRACMTGAIKKDKETGVVTTDDEKCVGCWMCLMSCSYGAIIRGEQEKVAFRCDFCPEAEEPVCVANCPNGALVYEEEPQTEREDFLIDG